MRSRTLVVLVAVVVLLGVYIVVHERHLPSTEEVERQADRVLPGLDREDVQSLEVVNRHGRFRLERSGDGWRLAEPGPFDADATAVASVVGALVDLEAERSLAADEADRSQLGLEQPELEVVLHTGDGQDLRLQIGPPLPLGSRRPVVGPGGAVRICSGGFAAGLDRELQGWRSRDVVDIFSDQVASVAVESEGGRAHAAREGRQWRLLEPLSDLADRDHISSLIADLNSLEVREFADQAAAADMALDAPRLVVTLIRSDGGEPVVLEFGAVREREGSTVVACRRGGEILWVSDRAEERLSRPPVLWRSRALYPFDSWDVEGLTLAAGDTRVELVRESGMWRLADGGEVDAAAAGSRLSRLADLEATEFDLVDVGAREVGRAGLELRGASRDDAEDRVHVEYVFLAPLEAGGDAAVRISGRPGLLGVDAGLVDQLLGDLESLAAPPPADEEDANTPG